MNTIAWFVTGGFAKGYRTQVLGVTAALSAIGLWAVGDMSLAEPVAALPVMLGGLGLAALGAKVDEAKRSRSVDEGPAKPESKGRKPRSCAVHALSFNVPANKANRTRKQRD